MRTILIAVFLALSVAASKAQSIRDQLQDQWVIDQTARAQQGNQARDPIDVYNELATQENQRLFEDAVENSKRVAIKMWPALGFRGTKFNNLFARAFDWLERNDPDYFNLSDWPLRLGQDCERKLRSEEQ